MRTTLNIEEDVLFAARERARREKRSLGAVVSELARRGLKVGNAPSEIAEEGTFFGFEPLPRRGPVVSNELIDRLRDEESE